MKILAFLLVFFVTPALADTYRVVSSTNLAFNTSTPVTYAMSITGIDTVRIAASTNIRLAFTTEPGSATTTGVAAGSAEAFYLPGEQAAEYFKADSSTVIVIIGVSDSGTVYISEVSK